MPKHRVPGKSDARATSSLPLLKGAARVRHAVKVDPVSRDDTPLVDWPDVDGNDLVEVQLGNAVVFWTSVDTLIDDTKLLGGSARSVAGATLPTRYPLGGTERGVVDAVISGLKIIDYDLPKGGALWVAEQIEDRLEGTEGLYRVDDQGAMASDGIGAGSDPVLLLIHGTGSSTTGAFGGLWNAKQATGAWDELQQRYDGRVFGFEHRSLTAGPVDNAVAFLESLPSSGAPPLHIVSHSRGGLVGDLLCHGGVSGKAFPKASLARYNVPKEQHDAYLRLSDLLAQKQPKVERFIRVACPAAGTTLASGRLDMFVSILVGLMADIPWVGPLLEGLGELAAAVAKERTKPEVLPGIEAMMPKSGFIRALNGSGHELGNDLRVIAGDSDGFWKNLANLFYWRQNDLVVDTRSMFGGAQRKRSYHYLAEGKEVDHFSYFTEHKTVTRLLDGLADTSGKPAGYIEEIPDAGPAGARGVDKTPAGEPGRPCVFLLPGVMGSRLDVRRRSGSNRIWLDPRDILLGNFDDLAVDSGKTVEATGLISFAYADLAKDLRNQGFHVVEFAYDWRLSITAAADKLAQAVKNRLAASAQNVGFVAHSMGGLVARAFMGRHPDMWQRLVSNRGARLVQLGTPNGGSYLVPWILQGREKIVKYLAGLDITKSQEDWIRLIAQFPGLAEMVPQSTTDPDFFDVTTWNKVRGVIQAPDANLLAEAKKVADLLCSVELAQHPVTYLAGRADETPVLDPESPVGEIRFKLSAEGDGRVPWSTGIPSGVPVYYADVTHGSLADHKPSFDGIRELVTQGATDLLSRSRPARRSVARSAAPPVRVGDAGPDAMEIFPSARELAAAALGGEFGGDWARTGDEHEVTESSVQVVHGDLMYAQHPVMVGHYAGDPIVHGEAALDRALGDELTFRHQLGLYPSEIGSAEVVLPRGCDGTTENKLVQGALIVGLGTVGDLTPGALSRSVKAGLLRYVQARRDRKLDASALKVSSLLIGSGEGGLALDQSVEAILTGLDLANRELRRLPVPDGEKPPAIVRLEFIEIYEDVAIEALHALSRWQARLPHGMRLHSQLARRAGNRHRASFGAPDGWWTRLSILADAKVEHQLNFTAFGGLARAPEISLHVQRLLVDQLLDQALSTANATQESLSQTLFELLVPRGFKGAAAGRSDLALVVDPKSARYPWELLVDRQSESSRPVGVGAGMLRQLKVENPETVAYAERRVALVVGDPPSTLSPLPGAVDEANEVAAMLSSTWSVVRQIRSDTRSQKEPGQAEISASSVIKTAMNQDFRVLHLAGHGVFDPTNPQRSGMVIGGDPRTPGQGVLLTPTEVAQMRLMPELVFINCCHLGRIEETPPHDLAANLAEQFIERGVRVVIAAGWAVDDRAALTFARAIYEELLSGSTLGDTVRAARERTYENHPGANTWGAYQCYGDPGYRLVMSSGVRAAHSPENGDRYVDPREIAFAARNIVSSARVQEGTKEQKEEKREARREEVRALEDFARRRRWDHDCSVAASLAAAYGELGEFGEAVRCAERARAGDGACITLKDREQYANFLVRDGEKRISDADSGLAASRAEDSLTEAERKVQEERWSGVRGEGLASIERGVTEIKRVLLEGDTSERHSLLASASKRLALAESGENEKSRKRLLGHVSAMARGYLRAAELPTGDIYYPAINGLLGILLLGGPWPDGTKVAKVDANEAGATAFEARVGELRTLVSKRQPANFWDAVAPQDLAVFVALADGKLAPSSGKTLADGYLALQRKHGSAREIDSVVTHLKFVQHVIENGYSARSRMSFGKPGAKKSRASVLRAIKRLRDQLQKG